MQEALFSEMCIRLCYLFFIYLIYSNQLTEDRKRADAVGFETVNYEQPYL